MPPPLLQATLKAATEVSKRAALKQSAVTQLAQGYGYWRTIEPLVAAKSQEAADIVSEIFLLDQAPAADAFAKASGQRRRGASLPLRSRPEILPPGTGLPACLHCENRQQLMSPVY